MVENSWATEWEKKKEKRKKKKKQYVKWNKYFNSDNYFLYYQ